MRFSLVTGIRYRATIRLGLFEQVASNDMIATKLLDAGIIHVTVWGSGRDRMADGEWSGATMQDVELPEQIKKLEAIP